MTKVLVTGANGFIGKSLVRTLETSGLSVVALNRSNGDITDDETWNNLPIVDHVFHLAARSFVPNSWLEPKIFLHTNVLGTQQALEYCRKYNSKLTFISAYLYGVPDRLPIHEDDPVNPNNPYALSKQLAEKLCEFYANHFDVTVTVIRPFNIFGPGQSKEFLIPEIIKQIKENNKISVKDLNPKRDYVYIDDLIEALIKTLDINNGHHVINIGSGESYSVSEIVNIIQKLSGTELPIVSSSTIREHEISDVRANIKRAQELLDWRPSHSFQDGVRQLIAVEGIQ